ncbi:MAG: SPOR domain-containing protein [Gemmatimonadota bacterium]|nr:SPOR domain-containing protein [Gemmatimonadota bacterium]
MRRLSFVLLSMVLVFASTHAAAQARPATTDTIYLRAQRMLDEGRGDAARALVQSQLETAPTGSARYVEAVYWRALLAANTADSERDLKRLVIDYPLSARTADALLRLGQLEIARGERQQAITHLDRLVKEHGDTPMRARASYWIARAWFDEGSVPTACARLGDAWRSTPADSAELRNQIEYYTQRCVGVDTTVQATASPRRVAGGGGVIVAGSPPGHTVPIPRPSNPTPPAPAPVAPRRDTIQAAVPPPRPTVARDNVIPVPTARDTTLHPVRDTSLRAASDTSLRPTRDTSPRPARDTAPPPVRSNVTTETVVLPPPKRDTARAPAPVPVPAPVTPPRTVVPPPVAPSRTVVTPSVAAPAGAVQWTVQVGAYKTREEAEQLRKTVVAQGLEPRVWENGGYFKVRVGRYASRTAAAAASDAIRQKHLAVYVTEAEPK